MSHAAFWQLKRESVAAGLGVCPYFRCKAEELSLSIDPHFSLSGDPLSRTYEFSLPPDVIAGLESVARDLDVPAETIGELVGAFKMPSLVEA
jgi:hypothetical protein